MAIKLLEKVTSPLKQRPRLVLIALLVLILAGAGFWFLTLNHRGGAGFHAAQVARGDLMASISATGTIEPEEVVDIGAQVAGIIKSFGKDKHGKTVDYGSEVEPGMVLAKIDDSLYAADVSSAKAQLEQNRAQVKYNEANLEQFKAKLYQATRDWARAQKLGPSDALSQAD